MYFTDLDIYHGIGQPIFKSTEIYKYEPFMNGEEIDIEEKEILTDTIDIFESKDIINNSEENIIDIYEPEEIEPINIYTTEEEIPKKTKGKKKLINKNL